MSIFTELTEDFKYGYEVMFENAKSEFEFKGTSGPIIALHGFGGGWAKNGFRKYMAKNQVSGILTYFGDIKDGLDKYIDQLDKYINRYPDSFILGFSAGGIIALKYADKYGWDKFKKIITVASPLFGSPPANKIKFMGETLKELVGGSDYLREIRNISPSKGKVLSIFSDNDLKAPFKSPQTLNWPIILLDGHPSHGQIHSDYKILEPIINNELGIIK